MISAWVASIAGALPERDAGPPDTPAIVPAFDAHKYIAGAANNPATLFGFFKASRRPPPGGRWSETARTWRFATSGLAPKRAIHISQSMPWEESVTFNFPLSVFIIHRRHSSTRRGSTP